MPLRKDRGRSLAPPLFYALVLLLWAGGAAVSQGPRPPIRLEVGPAQIALLDRSRGDTLRYALAGDTLTVDVLVNGGRGQALTGVEFYLRFEPGFLTPVDADTGASGVQPVRSGGLIRGAQVIINAFNVEDANRYRGIHYAEGLLSGSATADSGRVGSVVFRMLKPIPAGGDVTVSVEGDTALFRSSYQVHTAIGRTFPLRPRNALHLTALPPVLRLPASLTVRADSSLTLDLNSLATDAEFGGRQVRWAVSARDSGVVVTLNEEARTARIAPRRTFAGATVLTFTATNPAGASAKGEVALQVTPPNRPPVISPQFPSEVRLTNGRSEPISLLLYVTDPEVTIFLLRWSFTGQRAVTPAVDINAALTITAPASWAGQERVTLTARDPEGASASVTFTVIGAGLPGDFNGDGAVNFDDFFAFAGAFGTAQGQAGFDAKLDMDRDGRVDLDDFFLFAEAFGKGR